MATHRHTLWKKVLIFSLCIVVTRIMVDNDSKRTNCYKSISKLCVAEQTLTLCMWVIINNFIVFFNRFVFLFTYYCKGILNNAIYFNMGFSIKIFWYCLATITPQETKVSDPVYCAFPCFKMSSVIQTLMIYWELR